MGIMDQRAGDVITKALRTRICLHPGDEVMVLYEGKIASEFGVSRTPIRQVLQTLAHEQLVETRPGIGTVGRPLDEGMFERDLKTAQSLLHACAKIAEHPTPRDIHFALTALLAMAKDSAGGVETRAAFFDVSSRLLETLMPTLTDPLVANFYTASYWRIIRWRLRIFDRDPDFIWDRMIALIDVAAKSANAPEPGAMFDAMAERAKSKAFAQGLTRDVNTNAPYNNVQNIR